VGDSCAGRTRDPNIANASAIKALARAMSLHYTGFIMSPIEKKKRSKAGCLWAALILVAVAILGGCVLVAVSLMSGNLFKVAASELEVGVDEAPLVDEVWSYGEGETKVIRIPITGFIHLGDESTMLGAIPSQTMVALRSIRAATHDDEVDGIILDIDSGGGGITASDVVFKALMNFREARPGRAVVSIFGDVAASGAYYIALASDKIMARPTSITGSIGVIMKTINLEELATKHGIKDVTIASGGNKDLLNPLKELSPEQEAILQEIVDEMHARFERLLADRRELHFSHAHKLADGRIFSSQKAMDMGLIDEIGYWEDAMVLMQDELDVASIKVFRYEEPFSFSDIFKVSSGAGLQPESALRRLLRPQLLYFWQF
jgi:protease IV